MAGGEAPSTGGLAVPERVARPSRPLIGIAFKFSGVLAFTFLWALVKYLGRTFPVGELVFFRSLFGLVPILVLVVLHPARWATLKTKRPLSHVTRASIGIGGIFFSFLTLTLLPLADATALTFLAPLILIGLAPVLLHEHVGPYRLGAAVVGFLGVLLVAAPHAQVTHGVSVSFWGVAAGLAAAFFIALVQVTLRTLGATENPLATAFWFTVTTTLVSAATLPFGAVWPTGIDIWLLVLSGLVGGVGQVLMTQAYRHADASVLAPLDYLQLPISFVVGVFLFSEFPTAFSLAGGTVILASGIFIALRERYLARRQGCAPVVVQVP